MVVRGGDGSLLGSYHSLNYKRCLRVHFIKKKPTLFFEGRRLAVLWLLLLRGRRRCAGGIVVGGDTPGLLRRCRGLLFPLLIRRCDPLLARLRVQNGYGLEQGVSTRIFAWEETRRALAS